MGMKVFLDNYEANIISSLKLIKGLHNLSCLGPRFGDLSLYGFTASFDGRVVNCSA